MARSTKDFGRDEFSSLLGATGEREALEAVRDAAKPKASAAPLRRHRDPTRQRVYHELLDEVVVPDDLGPESQKLEDEDVDTTFTAASRQRRFKTVPVIMSIKPSTSATSQHNDDESSSSSEEGRKRVESSSSSDDDSIDNRRQRLLSKRKRQAPQIIQATTADVPLAKDPLNEPPVHSPPVIGKVKRARQESSSSSDSGESSSEEESSSSEDDDGMAPIRPVFIPRHKRGLKQSVVAPLSATNAKPMDERRIAESRALVQQAVTTVKKEVRQGVPTIDGVVGAMNDVPDDSDANLEHMDWVVRELERLLLSRDLEEEQMKEQAERDRRRNMTDEERMAEDAEKLQSKPKLDRKNQRFFHKGAFYMDESEWDEADVRRKATEYAAAVTGDDKRDRSQLPKVMQVKKFGFANQSKWKGLAKEDTTDKRVEMLPLKNAPSKKK